MKKVSIIIPVYNGSNYIRDAIESALSQTYENKEIIVVNDGSNDNDATKKIVEEYKDKVIYYEKENGGVSTALNLGIEKSTGDYISWLSHDDIYYPNKLERQIEEISKYDDETILYSNYDLIDLEGNKFNTVILDHEMLKNKPDYALLEGLIGGITLLIPKQAFEECGMFDEKYRCVQDYIKWFEFIKKYHFVHMPEVLAASRVHPKQVTYNSPVMIKEGNYLWAYMIENYPKEKKIACEGSCYAFYQEMEKHLKTTPYREAEQKVHELKIQCLEKEKDSKLPSITIVVIGKEDKERTISSIKKQTIKEYKIIETNSLEKSLKNIDTDYYTFLTSGTTVKENWLENILTIAKISNKSVIISDYKKPLLAGSIDNYCSYLVPLDGVIFKNEGNVKFINTYQYILDKSLINGSITIEDNYLDNVKEEYIMTEVYDYLKKVLEINKYTSYQLATLNYDISVIYNKYSTDGKKVKMYEDSDEYRELKYSRSFRLFQKYYNYKKKKKKTI